MIRRILIYSLVFIALSYVINWTLMEGLRRNRSGIYEKYNTTFLKHNNYNTIMLGSSRMFMHLENTLFDSITGTNSYNIGLPGATTRMSYTCLRAYCHQSDLPQTIFYELDFHISHLRTDTIYNFTTYFPYLSNPELYHRFVAIDGRFQAFKHIPLYSLPYSSIPALSASVNGWTGREGPYDADFEQGFFRNKLKDGYNNVQVKSYTGSIGQESQQYLDSVISFCRDHHIRLVFTMSPAYKDSEKELVNRERIVSQFRNIALTNTIPLLDLSTDSTISNHQNFFEDNYHMLYPGARLYTRKIAFQFNNISASDTL